MKRFEKMKNGKELLEVVSGICDLLNEKVDCENCPFEDRCYMGHNGIEDYLMEEVEE